MNKLHELIAALEALQVEGRGLLDTADTETRELTADEQSRLDAITAEATAKKAEIAAQQRKLEQRAAMESLSEGVAGANAIATAAGAGGLPVNAISGRARQNMVHEADPRLTHGYKDIVEFATDVRRACNPSGARIDPRLLGQIPGLVTPVGAAPTNYHESGGDAGEGFALPPAYRDAVFEVIQETDEFGPLVDEEPTDATRVEMMADETTPWGSTGVQANWRAEGTQMSATKLALDGRSVTMHEIYAFVLATEELLKDAPRLAGRMTRGAGQALAWKKNDAIVWGTGAGQPLGWMNAGCLLSIAKEGGQAADTIQRENVTKMFERFLHIPGDKPFWLANRNTLTQLMGMTIGDQPIWVSSGGLADAPGGFLLGYPVKFSEHSETLGDQGDIMLVSPKGYYSLVRDSGAEMAESIHLYFDYAIKAFRWMTRFGGQPHLEAAVAAPTRAGGAANSKSHFVTLDERA